MSKFTTQLRWLVDTLSEGLPVPDGQQYPDNVYKGIGLDKYPIFDELYRPTLNDKIINHYYFREIGFETAAQFAWYMRQTMWEIMPYYNELYKTQNMIDDPLSDYARKVRESWNADIKDRGNIDDIHKGGTTTKTDANGDSHNRNVYQDTPMSILSNVGAPSVEGLDYATTVTYDDGRDSSHSQSTTDRNATDSRVMNTDKNDSGWRARDESGRNKSQAALLKEYRDLYVNIDLEIIEDLQDLFLKLW